MPQLRRNFLSYSFPVRARPKQVHYHRHRHRHHHRYRQNSVPSLAPAPTEEDHNQCKWPVLGPIYFDQHQDHRTIQFGEKDNNVYMIYEDRNLSVAPAAFSPSLILAVKWDPTSGCQAVSGPRSTAPNKAYFTISCDSTKNTYTLVMLQPAVLYFGGGVGDPLTFSLRSFSGKVATFNDNSTIAYPVKDVLVVRDIQQFGYWPWGGSAAHFRTDGSSWASPVSTACSANNGVTFQLVSAQPSDTTHNLAPKFVVFQGCTGKIMFFWNQPSKSPKEHQWLTASPMAATAGHTPWPWGENNTQYPKPFLFQQREDCIDAFENSGTIKLARADLVNGKGTYTTEYRYWTQDDGGNPLGTIVNGMPTFEAPGKEYAYYQVGLTYITATTDYNGRASLNLTNTYFGGLNYEYYAGGCVDPTTPNANFFKPPEIQPAGAASLVCRPWYSPNVPPGWDPTLWGRKIVLTVASLDTVVPSGAGITLDFSTSVSPTQPYVTYGHWIGPGGWQLYVGIAPPGKGLRWFRWWLTYIDTQGAAVGVYTKALSISVNSPVSPMSFSLVPPIWGRFPDATPPLANVTLALL